MVKMACNSRRSPRKEKTMSNDKLIELLNGDLKNEWTHMNFYLYHASAVVGLHRHEFKEFFAKEAASEMQHVLEFSDMIRGLGGSPIVESHVFKMLSDPREIIEAALQMEEHVVDNYTNRIVDASKMSDAVNARWLEIFLEKQIEHSREDVDEFRQILKGMR